MYFATFQTLCHFSAVVFAKIVISFYIVLVPAFLCVVFHYTTLKSFFFGMGKHHQQFPFFSSSDPPYVVTESTTLSNLEEEKDSVTMRCMAESNPPAKVWWEKEGVNGIFSPDKEITISPVTRTTAGTYKCVAQNALGMSEPAFVELDVKCKSHHHQTNTAV